MRTDCDRDGRLTWNFRQALSWWGAGASEEQVASVSHTELDAEFDANTQAQVTVSYRSAA